MRLLITFLVFGTIQSNYFYSKNNTTRSDWFQIKFCSIASIDSCISIKTFVKLWKFEHSSLIQQQNKAKLIQKEKKKKKITEKKIKRMFKSSSHDLANQFANRCQAICLSSRYVTADFSFFYKLFSPVSKTHSIGIEIHCVNVFFYALHHHWFHVHNKKTQKIRIEIYLSHKKKNGKRKSNE